MTVLRLLLEVAAVGGQVWSVLHSICFFTAADWHWKVVRPSFSKKIVPEKKPTMVALVEARPVELLNGMTEGLVGMKLLASKEAMAGGGGKGG